jgi:hypothetical protein
MLIEVLECDYWLFFLNIIRERSHADEKRSNFRVCYHSCRLLSLIKSFYFLKKWELYFRLTFKVKESVRKYTCECLTKLVVIIDRLEIEFYEKIMSEC